MNGNLDGMRRANAMANAPAAPYLSRGADYAKHVETLRGCADPTQGRVAEAGIAADGLQRDTFLGNLLVQMYGRCRLLDEAFVAFDRIASKNAFSYTLLMSACVHNGRHRRALDVYKQMRRQPLGCGAPADQVTLLIALSACSRLGDLAQGLEIHDDAGASPSPAVQNAVMSMYERCGSLDRAWVVFRSLQDKSVVSWNTMIAANARNGQGREALRLLSEMDLEGQRADQYTFVSILGACSSPAMLVVGRRLHHRISCQGYELNVFVATALVTMYSRAGRIDLARSAFEGLVASCAGAGVVSWNAMLAAEAQAGDNTQVLELYDRMQLAAVEPDSFTCTIVLTACATSGTTDRGLELAAAVERRPAAMADEVVQNALVNLYARCGKLREARAVAVTSRSVAAWNSVIAAYDRCGRGDVAIELYDAMAARGIAADEYTFAAVVGACTSTGELEKGRAVHVAITAAGMDGDDVVKRGLVNMYAKCGSLDDARAVFVAMDDVVSWTAMIVGYSHHGRGREATAMFKAMILAGLHPDCITLTAVLHACSHDGIVEEARSYIRSMGDDYGIELTLEHYHCIIDLLARLGRLGEALEVIENMPFDSSCDVVAWMSLLSACKTHKNLKHASAVVRRIEELGRRGAAPYIIVSSIVTPDAPA